MTAVSDGRAVPERIVLGAEEFPFREARFGTGLDRVSRGIGEQGDDYMVDFLDQEAAKLVEPDFVSGVGRRVDEIPDDDDDCVGVMQGFEVFSQVEGGVEL